MQYAEETKMFYLETSAMTADNVDTAFMAVVKGKPWNYLEIIQKQIDKQKLINTNGKSKDKNSKPL